MLMLLPLALVPLPLIALARRGNCRCSYRAHEASSNSLDTTTTSRPVLSFPPFILYILLPRSFSCTHERMCELNYGV